jgi:predicted metal-dependent hydrolase
VSEYFIDAPLRIIKILAIILLAKVYKYKVDKEIKRDYQKYLKDLQKLIPGPTRRAPINYNHAGNHYNLKDIFDALNENYFSNQLQVKFKGWSKNKSYSRLGFYDKERDLLVISKIFDSPKVPQQVIEFLVYHEMLHILFPVKTKNGRRRIHSKELKKTEQKFPEYDKINQWINKNRYKL